MHILSQFVVYFLSFFILLKHRNITFKIKHGKLNETAQQPQCLVLFRSRKTEQPKHGQLLQLSKHFLWLSVHFSPVWNMMIPLFLPILDIFFLSFLQHECCLNSKIISFSKVLDKMCIEYVTVIYYLGEDLKGGQMKETESAKGYI